MRPELTPRHLKPRGHSWGAYKGPMGGADTPWGRGLQHMETAAPKLRQAGTGLKGEDAGRDNNNVNKLAKELDQLEKLNWAHLSDQKMFSKYVKYRYILSYHTILRR